MEGNPQNKSRPVSKTRTKSKTPIHKKRRKKRSRVAYGIFIAVFCLFVSAMLTVIVVGSSVLAYVDDYVEGKKIIDLENYTSSQSQTSIMYAYDENNKAKELTRLHGEENRIWVDYDQMPDNLINAFVSLEDKRFWSHPGVDWTRTIAVLVNPEYEGQGASTITQQLVKNLTDQKDVTYVRKFNEILRALNLERYYSKKEILEAYLNTVSLGAGAYGVETAAEIYFGKSVEKLSLIECATLAGITKAPYTLNPYYDYNACKERRDTCLWYMMDNKKITESQYKKSIKKKITLAEKKSSSQSNQTDDTDILSWYEEYVIDQVIADLQSEYGYEYNEAWRMVYYGGLSIYSAVDTEIQDWVEKVYKDRLGFPYSRTDKNGNLPQSSITIMDYQGRIVAIAGGTGKKTTNRGYNRATDTRAKRQPGSSIKPLSVYSPAIDQGLITPSSTILEKAITLNGSLWPRNFNGDHGSGRYITVQEALVRSLNTVPVRILKEMLGVKTSYQYCNEKFHLNLSERDMDLSPLAVGGTNTGVTSLEMAAAFATFGNGGNYYKPYSYYKVLDRNGEVILDNRKNEPERAIENATANATLGMMLKAVSQSNGTGYGSAISGFQTFAKTGTTSDNCDKWYCGGTPYYVTAIWYGFDYHADLYTGSSNPAKNIFRYVFSEIHKNLKSKTFADLAREVGADPNAVLKAIKDSNAVHSASQTTTAKTAETTTHRTTEKTTASETTKRKTNDEDKTTTTSAPKTTEPSTERHTTTEPPTTAAPPSTTQKPTDAPDTSKPATEPSSSQDTA